MPHQLEPGFGVQIEGEDGAELQWRVTEVADEGIVLVGSSSTPAPGERVRIAWGSAKGAFTGVTRVLEADDSSEGGLVQLYNRIVVENPDHVKKEERRRFMRVPCSVPFQVVIDGREITGSSEDVSANGLRGRIRGSVPSVPVEVQLSLPSGLVSAQGRIVRCRPVAHPAGTWEIGVAYVAPNPRTEDRIVSFVLARERELVRVIRGR